MTSARVAQTTCACGWSGPLPARASCPSCGSGLHQRVSPVHRSVLRSIAAGERVVLVPMMRLALERRGLIRSEPIAPVERRRLRAPARRLVLTERGARMASAT